MKAAGRSRCTGRSRLLDEAEAKAALAAHGLPVPNGALAATPDEAAAAAARIGFPVALKGRGVAHKAEAGAVRLNLHTAEAVAAAARGMDFASGFLVERMVEGSVAELILGVMRDPVYGYTLTIGAGGILTELLADAATLMIPATEAEIRAALAGLKSAPLLQGYRGRAKAGARRDRVLARLGYRVLRLSANLVLEQPVEAVARVRAALTGD